MSGAFTAPNICIMAHHPQIDHTNWGDTQIDGKCHLELRQWLIYESRCFGDKGDVEDITEGQC